MFPPSKPEDDDDIGLPALPPLGQDEELATEFGLETDFGDEESASLDDSTAADMFDASSFLSFDEGPSVINDGLIGGLEDASDAFPEAGQESEYGYTDGNEPLKDLELGGELVSTAELPGTDDGGAEGLDDLFPLAFDGDDSLTGLAPLLLDPDDDGKEELMEELELSIPLEFQFEEPQAPSSLPPKGRARVRWPLAEACNAIAIGPDNGIVVGGLQLFARRGEDNWERLRGAGLEDAEIISLAFHRGTLVAGTRLKGVFVSVDGGASFEPRNGWCRGQQPSVPCRVLVDGSQRLWMTSGGALYRTEDASRWLGPLLPIPVTSIAVDGDGAAAMALGDDGATLFVSADGVRWARRSLDLHATEGTLTMHEGKALVAIPLDQGGPFSELEPGGSRKGLAGCSRVLTHNDTLFGLRHVAADDRVLVVRYRGGEMHTLLDEASGQAAGPDGNHRIHDALVAPDGSLWLALGGGVAHLVPE
ncbi:MAG: hypothetical protein ACI9KE_004454 [Polyangiales bacterium]|jgi:hypothetical protein